MTGRALVSLFVDLLIVVACIAVLAIGATGGGMLTMGSLRIGMRSVDNPLLIVFVLAVVRYGLRGWGPFLLRSKWGLANADASVIRGLTSVDAWDRSVAVRTGRVLLIGGCLAVIAVKAFNAWRSPGFFSGDDLEVQEMSLSALGRLSWPIWDLRSPVFPLGIVFPAHWAARAAGIVDRETLVFAGRLPVVVLSTLAVAIVFRVIERGRGSGWALIAAAAVAVNALQMAFGSSELPRPVSTVLVLTAYAMTCSGSTPGRSMLAGVVLGVAATFRFSEAVFLVPAVVSLAFQRRLRSAVVLLLAAACTIGGLLAVTDRFYWGEAFHSARQAIDYTLVHRLSSRGYQHPLWYLTALPEWINPAIFVLAIARWRYAAANAALWAFAPLVILSLLPHKEARYAIPIVPFVCLAAVGAAARIAADAVANPGVFRRVPAALVLVLLGLGAVRDVAHWRLPRTDADVRLAQELREVIPAGAEVAIEQAWRMGGRVYLDRYRLRDLDPARLDDRAYFDDAAPPGAWVVVDSRTIARGPVREYLQAREDHLVLRSETSRFTVWMPPR